MIKLWKLKCKVKGKFHKKISDQYDHMNCMKQSNLFMFHEDLFAKNAQRIAFILHEARLKLIFFNRQSHMLKVRKKHNIICFLLSLKIYQMKDEKIKLPQKSFLAFPFLKIETEMEKSRICDICNIVVHRTSFVKTLRSKKQLEKEIPFLINMTNPNHKFFLILNP